MDDQSTAAQRQAEANATPPPPKITEPASPDPAKPATAEQLKDVEQMTGFERATLRWARIAVWMSAVAAAFVCAQWYEMHSGATDTHTLAQAADKQAGKMADMYTAADKIRQAAENMVIQDQRIADNAQKGIEASNKQSEAVLHENIEASHLDQRAWVGIKYSRVVPWPPVTDKSISAEVGVLNTGKTNAQKSEVALHVAIRPKAVTEPPKNITFTDSGKSVATIFPQQMLVSNVTVKRPDGTEIKPTDDNVASFKAGDIKIFVWGEITYRDIFNKPHKTKFCSFFSGTDETSTACAVHNEAD